MKRIFNGSYSIKKLQVIIICVFVIHMITFQLLQNYYSIKLFNSEIENQANSTIYLYQNQLETAVNRIQTTLANNIAQEVNHLQMNYKQSELDLLEYSYNISKNYTSILNSESLIASIFLVSNVNDKIISINDNQTTSFEEREEMYNFIKSSQNKSNLYFSLKWTVKTFVNRKFLVRFIGTDNCYIVCILNLNESILPQNASYISSNTRIIYSTYSGEPITSDDYIKENNIKLYGDKEGMYFSNPLSDEYVIVQQKSDIVNLNIVYIEKYSILFSKIGKFNLIIMILSLLTITILPIILINLRIWYLKPLEKITQTLYSIRGKNLQTRLMKNYKIKELNDLAVSFNEMMDEVENLKIEKYEKEIKYQYTQLQYLQLQISPHFFLNYLKTLYAMVENKNTKKLQESILMISKYTRYIFHNNKEKVNLNTEIEHVINYIQMQEYMTGKKIECNIEIDDDIKDGLVPTLCIQTFVENSVKYARIEGQMLKININVMCLQSEDGKIMDITITDNGPGMNNDIIENFNKQVEFDYSENHIGINNIRQRLTLMYGDKSGFACMNMEEGVMFELIIPYENQ